VSIVEIPGVRVGHWTDLVARTGCTVILFPPPGAVAGVAVRGAAPATRETDLLRPGNLVERVHAICLTGGSAFGLAAADGVMRYLRERGVGFPAGRHHVPIVPAAALFDLEVGAAGIVPGPDQGYAACLDAERDEPPAEGAVGAGAGATVGKLLGLERSCPGGVGTALVRLPGGPSVGALAAVNALGDVVDRGGRVVAGARDEAGGFVDGWRALLEGRSRRPTFGNTTLGLVVTDAALDRARCRRLAEVAQDALALAIRPAHTLYDGDAVFAASVGEVAAEPTALGAAAVEALRTAIERAVGRG
jgi:L-aminopeptidase/D-esterase-like protein